MGFGNASPERLHQTASVDALVLRHDRRAEFKGRCHDQPIGRIPMEYRTKQASLRCNCVRDHGDSEARNVKRLLNRKAYVTPKAQTTLLHEHSHFPTADGGEDELSFAVQTPAHPRRDLVLIRRPPEPRMRVENDHRSASQGSSIGETRSS